MADYLGNPALIYEGPNWLPTPGVPLILMHDGGGTTFSYHCLDPTNRPLYGVENPHLHEGGWWDGGIPEMAKHYIDLMAKALPQGGRVILGGWSLGGILSLEMAHQIATNANMPVKFEVLGIIMVDSVAPRKIADFPDLAKTMPTQRVDKSLEEVKAMKLKEKVDLNMTHARVMIGRYDLPKWDRVPVPPTILLRAKEPIDGGAKSFVDYLRHERLLGWNQYHEENGNFIRSVIDVEGHHFNIFQEEYISDITNKICSAADILDKGRF